MKNQKFSKSPKFFAFYLESSKNVLHLEIHWGALGRRNIAPGASQHFWFFFRKLSQDQTLNFKILLMYSDMFHAIFGGLSGLKQS